MTKAELAKFAKIQKRCQVGTRNYDEANNLHMECYTAIGQLLNRIQALESVQVSNPQCLP